MQKKTISPLDIRRAVCYCVRTVWEDRDMPRIYLIGHGDGDDRVYYTSTRGHVKFHWDVEHADQFTSRALATAVARNLARHLSIAKGETLHVYDAHHPFTDQPVAVD